MANKANATITTRGDKDRNPEWPHGLQMAYYGLEHLYAAMLAFDELSGTATVKGANDVTALGVSRHDQSYLFGQAFNLWRTAEEKLAPAFAEWERRQTEAADAVTASLGLVRASVAETPAPLAPGSAEEAAWLTPENAAAWRQAEAEAKAAGEDFPERERPEFPAYIGSDGREHGEF